MKKIMAVCFALLACALALTACSEEGTQTTTAQTTAAQTTAAQTTTPPSITTTESTDLTPPPTVEEIQYSEGLIYRLNSDKSGYMVVGIGICVDTDVLIPPTYQDLPVTEIGNEAFKGCNYLYSVTIPNSVTSIGGSAFSSCGNLESINIPNSVTSIGDRAFEGCRSFTSITIPDSVTSIGDYAFASCSSFTSITIPDSVTSIGDYAFASCSSFTSITIPDSVKLIGLGALNGCTKLESLTIPFLGASKNVTNDACFWYFFDSTYSVPKSLKNVVITGGRTIYANAFKGCENIKSLTIPDSVTRIETAALSGCTSIESITIPFVGNAADGTGLTYLGSIFSSRIVDYRYPNDYVPLSLKNVTVTGGNTIHDKAFYYTNIVNVTICDGVKTIGSEAFGENFYLSSIVIPDSVTSIGSDAFRGCSTLKHVTISDQLMRLYPDLFTYSPFITNHLQAVSGVTGVSGPKSGDREGYEKLFDGDVNTKLWAPQKENAPIVVNLGGNKTLKGISLVNANDNESFPSRTVCKFEIWISDDGVNWGTEAAFRMDDTSPYSANYYEIYWFVEIYSL